MANTQDSMDQDQLSLSELDQVTGAAGGIGSTPPPSIPSTSSGTGSTSGTDCTDSATLSIGGSAADLFDSVHGGTPTKLTQPPRFT